ncbi:MAG: hypothetical protein ACT4N2_12575 [Hyphomicrobium sp.]
MDEFLLLLALVGVMLPLQYWLAFDLHRKSTAGTSFFDCFLAISKSDIHIVKDQESDEFKSTMKRYQRRYFLVLLPAFAIIFGVYLWKFAD